VISTTVVRMWVFMCGLAAATPAQAVARETRFSDTEGVLGTTLRVGIDATSASASEASEAAVRKEIARLDAVLSGWTPDREFSKLQAAGRGVGVSPDLFAVLDAAERFRAATGGRRFIPRSADWPLFGKPPRSPDTNPMPPRFAPRSNASRALRTPSTRRPAP
jgi:thiamine biosynthesis lipoprotein ApbE